MALQDADKRLEGSEIMVDLFKKLIQDYMASFASYLDRKMIVYLFPSLSTLSSI